MSLFQLFQLQVMSYTINVEWKCKIQMTGRVHSILLSNTVLTEANVFQISQLKKISLLPQIDIKTSYLKCRACSCLKYNKMMLNAKFEVLKILIYKTINL
jgi:hypothetical protein